MKGKKLFSLVLAILGTLLAWLPGGAVLLFDVFQWVRSGTARVDYLLPAEAFPVILAGFILMLWVALREKLMVKPLAWTFGAAIAAVLIGMLVAKLSGLADGLIEPQGFWWSVMLGMILLYDLAVTVLGFMGFWLIGGIIKKK